MLTGDLPRYHFAGLTSCSIASSCSWSIAARSRRECLHLLFVIGKVVILTGWLCCSVVQVLTLLTVSNDR